MNLKKLKYLIGSVCLLFGTQVNATFLTSVQSPYKLIGSSFSVDIVGTGATSSIDGGGLNLTFDQTVVNVLSVNIDESVWNSSILGVSTGIIDNIAGTVNGIIVNTSENILGDFVIATIEFEAIGLGESWLRLTELDINPWTSGGNLVLPEIIDTSVKVIPVPIIGTISLFSIGLFGLFRFTTQKPIFV